MQNELWNWASWKECLEAVLSILLFKAVAVWEGCLGYRQVLTETKDGDFGTFQGNCSRI